MFLLMRMLPYLLILACLPLASTGAPLPADSRPNILLLLVDDLGQQDIGAYNADTFYETPQVDRIAREGVRFSSGYAANPVCSPTRYSIMTGRYPTRAMLTNWLPGQRTERFRDAPLAENMASEEVTIAEILRGAGYRTAIVGKWHLGKDEAHWPEAQGFEVNIGGWAAGHPRSYFSPYRNPKLADGPDGEYLAPRLATETINLIHRFHEERKPFLIVHSFYNVHTPLHAPKDLVEKYQRKAERLGLRDKFGEEAQYHFDKKEKRLVRRIQCHPVYAAMVESMDRAVGRILDALQELGLSKNTLVVFVSDNGGLSTSEGSPTSNLPLRGGKGWVYEGGIRVPFIIKAPFLNHASSRNPAPVCTTDLLPTFLACSSTPLPAGLKIDGKNLCPLLDHPRASDLDRTLYWHYPHYSNQGGFPGGAIRQGDWKLVENYEDGSMALYHLADDIGEQYDLAAKQPERAGRLRASLHSWYAAIGARFLRSGKVGLDPWKPRP